MVERIVHKYFTSGSLEIVTSPQHKFSSTGSLEIVAPPAYNSQQIVISQQHKYNLSGSQIVSSEQHKFYSTGSQREIVYSYLGPTGAGVEIPLSSVCPQPLSETTCSSGTSLTASRDDHVHYHGQLSASNLHAVADSINNGFMSAFDWTHLNNLPFDMNTVADSLNNGFMSAADWNHLNNFPVSALSREPGDFVSFPQKNTVSINDVICLEDSQDSYNKKSATIESVLSPLISTGNVTLYLHFNSGDDNNDGLSNITAVRTWEKIQALVPKMVNGNVVINVSGDDTGEVIPNDPRIFLSTQFLRDGWFVVASEEPLATVESLGFTVTNVDTTKNQITVNNGGYWAPQQHDGNILAFETGAETGQFLIVDCLPDTLTLDNVSYSISVGDVISIKTLATRTHRDLKINIQGPGRVVIQRMALPDSIVEHQMKTTVNYYSSVHCDGINVNQTDSLKISGELVDLVDPGNTALRVASFQSYFGGNVFIDNCNFLEIGSGLITTLRARNCTIRDTLTYFRDGVEILDCKSHGNDTLRLKRTTTWDSAQNNGVGVKITNSNVGIFGGGEINNCRSHAFEIKGSTVNFNGVTGGGSNGGAGVYAHFGSKVTFSSGYPPTITGTVGEISTDGTTQKDTWANVAAGNPIIDTTEMTIVKSQPY